MHSEASPEYSRYLDIRRSNITELPISLPTSLVSRAESLRRPATVPTSNGVCFWYFRDVPAAVPTVGCPTLNGCTLLYLALAPDGSGRSGGSLLSCIARNYRPNIERSSLRKTLGILLEEQSGFPLLRAGSGQRTTLTNAGERWLDDWMEKNAFVGWTEHPEPWLIEYELLLKLPCPLNISHNGHHPFASALRRMRLDAIQRSRALEIASERTQRR
jgi:hypothetical protein